ncbi:hypothetical protein N9U01_00480 [Paracoccaceae bacterium]|nr:hypothetical protein [Paracoccaceae bacterium]
MALNRFHIVSPLALMAFSACRSPYLGEGGAQTDFEAPELISFELVEDIA